MKSKKYFFMDSGALSLSGSCNDPFYTVCILAVR